MSTVKTGHCKFFNSTKGYGFVIPDEPIEGNAEVFVHHTVIHNSGGFKSLAEGELVSAAFSAAIGMTDAHPSHCSRRA
ncbi:hypothetical protein DL89DRAFT_263971 [Linderina pennispora]|uniref:CSD domain-containing protein n=1 Tax=Linderina pennispora TaxID=61395 RepID=A0A1Y1WKH3_9FUNG|nr:uncharacterized protein DL89DRAFT_263971 [Linderina pennispora]ORX73973.1 hypothetical protein DL89DRAFT_263971 [Linderina pennispora]